VAFKGQMKNAGASANQTVFPAQLDDSDNFSVETHTDEQNRYVDKIDYPFISDPEAIGRWTSVDFVNSIENFDPTNKSWSGDLFLKGFVLNQNGTTSGPWQWTKGIITHPGDQTAARYLIKDFNGVKYMFFEWKSGDYTIRHEKPSYYVLKKAG
jgi:bla regulator protein BlaR1